MKLRRKAAGLTSLVACLSFLLAPNLSAQNTSTTVSQVTSQVTLSSDVDYHVSGSTPFATTGSIDITNTDHAVVIFDAIKPSKLKSYLSYVTINGAKAVDGTNCQVKLYSSLGSMILPYGDDVKMLTCYTEPNFQGESCSDYAIGTSNGYMNTITTAKLNNRIRSFILKRGYMVTFAVGQAGYGYSRCFIAQDADLEVSELPAVLDGRISSYRLFKWQATGKNGVVNGNQTMADDMNEALNTSWSFSWYWSGIGSSQLPDRDYVVHQYKEFTPHTDALGNQNWTCHMKTNNEPANSADEAPCTVDDVLANWEAKMRTGLRLCSPSQHDSGLSWTRAFMDSIDARGWRCDIVDIHCYWPEWNLLNQVAGYYTKYQRPVWITEFIWGASWNHNGIFVDGKTDTDNYNVMSNVLNNWNKLDCLERYAYWNAESKGHIYENGALTQLGEFYSKMQTGLGYKTGQDFVPAAWRFSAAHDLTATYSPNNSSCLLKWTDDNFDMLDTMIVQRQFGDDGTWESIGSVELKDAYAPTYQYRDTLDAAGLYNYRILTRSYNSRTYTSSTASVTKGGALGNDVLQYGSIPVGDISTAVNVSFQTTYASRPIVITGLLSNNNINTTASTYMGASSVSTTAFNYLGIPWQYQPSGTTTYTNPEEISFLALPEGNYTWGDMTAEAKTVLLKDTTEFTFDVPFPEGVTPVVIGTINRASTSARPTMHKIWNVSNTGFTATVMYEQGAESKVAVNQRLSYLAVSPGSECIDEDNGIYLSAGLCPTNIYGITRSVYFTKDTDEGTDTLMMEAPYFFGEFQTANTPVPAIARKTGEISKIITDSQGERYTYTVGMRVRRVVDKSVTTSGTDTRATADHIGWLAIHSPLPYDPVAIHSLHSDTAPALRVNVENGVISVDGQSDIQVYSLSGARLDSRASLPRGIYVVRAGGQSQKVVVK